VFKSLRVGTTKKPVVVAGVFSDATKLPGSLPRSEAGAIAALEAALKTPGFTAEAGETVPAGQRGLLVGLGKRAELTTDSLRTTSGKIVRALDRMGARAVNLAGIAAAIEKTKLDPAAAGRAAAEGMALANWRVDFFEGKATKYKPPKAPLTIDRGSRAFAGGLREGLLLAECQNYARQLGATPPNICTPMWLAGEAKRLAREVGLRYQLIDAAAAQRLGMGGLVNVGKGSANKPCMIVLEHRPARAARNVRLALVGKTMTYDTGGYSLKINNTMKGMKYDKCGGTAVLGAMRALALRRTPVHVVGVLPAAENMVSEDSYRPDDIITMHNGVSVEVTNTDAEGRLILGDALSWVCKQHKPTAIVDLATLTGGVVVALGHFCSGLFCNDQDMLERATAAAEATGEPVWRLPLWKDHRDFMRAKHADIRAAQRAPHSGRRVPELLR
jgi:leucyl aminopeptidase